MTRLGTAAFLFFLLHLPKFRSFICISIMRFSNVLFAQRNCSPSWSDDKDGNLTELVLQNELKVNMCYNFLSI